MVKKILISALLVALTSFYLFPVSFWILPESLNSKIILAGFGILAFFYDKSLDKSVNVPRPILFSGLLAFIFSLWCLFCVVENGTDDFTYANYWVSFFTWTFGAYAICFLLRTFTGKIDLKTLTFFLTLVCVAQCILAELIDTFPGFQQAVDHYFVQGHEFFQEVHRLYGIGAYLDPAGVRFSAVLILIAHQMIPKGEEPEKENHLTVFYIISFLVIVIIGSIIARTTWVGAAMGLAYYLVAVFQIKHGEVSYRRVRILSIFMGIVFLTILVVVYLYRTNPAFRSNLRFGFEGFFNWAETGVFRTDSTDKLNRIMWVWPKDNRSWIIGTGLFENWAFGTDIGYCRFTLYCGIVGLGLFSLYFIYNGLAIRTYSPGMGWLVFLLIALCFIIWVKVSTDLFFIFVLLHWLPKECTSSTT